MESLREKLFEIYDLTTRFMEGEELSQKEIIETAATFYVDNYNEFPEQLKDVFEGCLNHSNMNVEEGTTLEEIIEDGYILVEELCGFLGEYFDD